MIKKVSSIILLIICLCLAACTKKNVSYKISDDPAEVSASLLDQDFSMMFQSYAYEKKESGGTVWCAPFAGIQQFDLPKTFVKAKGTVTANGGSESIPGAGLVTMDVVYFAMPEKDYTQLTDTMRLASIYAQANTQFLLQYQVLANKYRMNSAQLFTVYGVKDKSTEEELRSTLSGIYKTYGGYDDEKIDELMKSLTVYPAGKADDYYYYIVQTDDDKEVTFESSKDRSKFVSEYESLKKSVKNYSSAFVFSRPLALTELNLSDDEIIRFDTTDINGNKINSEELFSRKKVTMMNIWSTTCSVCLTEMPELQKMNDEFAEKGGQVVGLLYDGDNPEAASEAKEFITELGTSYTNIIANDTLKAIFPTQSFPMTYFFDENGKLIGDPVIGANLPKYRALLEKYTQ